MIIMTNTDIIIQIMLQEPEKRWKVAELVEKTGIGYESVKKALTNLKYRLKPLVSDVERGVYVLTNDAIEAEKRRRDLLLRREEAKGASPDDESNPQSIFNSLLVFFSNHKSKEIEQAEKNGEPACIEYGDIDAHDPRIGDMIQTDYDNFSLISDKVLSSIGITHVVPIIKNVPAPQILIRDIRAKHIGLYINVVGRIRRASKVEPVITAATFECRTCGARITLLQDEDHLIRPQACECGKRGFDIIIRKMVDMQSVKLEEDVEGLEGNMHTQTIEVVLRNHLVDSDFQKKIVLGSKVMVSGVVLDRSKRDRRGREQPSVQVFLSACDITPQEDSLSSAINEDDIKKITALSKTKNILEIFARSIAPGVLGFDEVKRGLALALFGGVRKCGTLQTIRGDIHMLLMGDPSVAKSVFLTEFAKLAPRARYAVGASSSGCGLTATVERDERTGIWDFVAGLLPMQSKGHACIDEFEKMTKEDREYILEAMEQQTVSLDKAGQQVTLPAQTSILAAANPKFGRFDPFEDILSQIDLEEVILSRFDLIFIMKDVPDENTDRAIGERLLGVHAGTPGIKPAIEPELLRKYVIYARENYSPKIPILLGEQKENLLNFYVNTRKTNYRKSEAHKIAMGARQFNAMVRLAEASAKMRLSDTVENEDIDLAKKMMGEYIQQIGYDIDQIESGLPSEKRQKFKAILKVVTDICSNKNGLAHYDEIRDALGFECECELDELSKKGEIFSPRAGSWRIV